MISVAPLSPLHRLQALGQSIWLDCPGRALARSGELAKLISVNGVSGVVSKFAICEKAVVAGHEYDREIAELAQHGLDAEAITVQLCVTDAQEWADSLRPVFEATAGRDGFASIAVSPRLAHDTDAAVREARWLWSRVARANVMVAVPATAAGVATIRELVADGINVHVTHLFGLARHRHVALAYAEGLRLRAMNGKPISHVTSVASFLLPLIDTLLDPRIEAMVALGSAKAAHLLGEVATSTAKIAYQRWRELFEGESFDALERRGARAQRLLWAHAAATSSRHSDVSYIEALIGEGTVTTMTPESLAAYRLRGRPRSRLGEAVQEAQAALANLASLGIDLGAVASQLEAEGIRKVTMHFDALVAAVARKLECADLHRAEPSPQS